LSPFFRNKIHCLQSPDNDDAYQLNKPFKHTRKIICLMKGFEDTNMFKDLIVSSRFLWLYFVLLNSSIETFHVQQTIDDMKERRDVYVLIE
jgi:hypothetical protein